MGISILFPIGFILAGLAAAGAAIAAHRAGHRATKIQGGMISVLALLMGTGILVYEPWSLRVILWGSILLFGVALGGHIHRTSNR